MNFRRRNDDRASREDPYNVTQASRIYFLPNLMTAGNLFCGFVAVIQCVQARLAETAANLEYLGGTAADHYRYAVWLILAAAAFDTLDGRLARMGGRESLFGAEFDSLADVISFGFAPALMVIYLIISPTQGYEMFRLIGWFLGFVYLLCAAIRLARFNVITNPLLHRDKKDTNKDFVGLPVPAAAFTVASLVLFLLHLAENDRALHIWALFLPPLLSVIAVLMVSTVRYPSGKNIDMQTKTRLLPFVAFLVFLGGLALFKEITLMAVALGYIFYGLIRQWRRPRGGGGNRPKPMPQTITSNTL
jgi:CDP-diacylglycerol--serine O-phosphatidyltransferase